MFPFIQSKELEELQYRHSGDGRHNSFHGNMAVAFLIDKEGNVLMQGAY